MSRPLGGQERGTRNIVDAAIEYVRKDRNSIFLLSRKSRGKFLEAAKDLEMGPSRFHDKLRITHSKDRKTDLDEGRKIVCSNTGIRSEKGETS